MNQINWLEVFNSSITFGLLAVIAITLLIIASKKDIKSKTPKKR